MKWLCNVLQLPPETPTVRYDPKAQLSVTEVGGRQVPAVSCLDLNDIVLETKTFAGRGDIDADEAVEAPVGKYEPDAQLSVTEVGGRQIPTRRSKAASGAVLATKTKVRPGDIDEDSQDHPLPASKTTFFEESE